MWYKISRTITTSHLEKRFFCQLFSKVKINIKIQILLCLWQWPIKRSERKEGSFSTVRSCLFPNECWEKKWLSFKVPSRYVPVIYGIYENPVVYLQNIPDLMSGRLAICITLMHSFILDNCSVYRQDSTSKSLCHTMKLTYFRPQSNNWS